MLLLSQKMQGFADQLKAALLAEQFVQARKMEDKVSAARTAQILLDIPTGSILQYFAEVGWVKAGQVAAHLPQEMVVQLLQQMSLDDAGSLLAEMSLEIIADLTAALPKSVADTLLQQLDAELQQQVAELRSYPEGTAGAEMSPYFLSVTADAQVKEVIAAVREAPAELARTAYIYVVDDNNHLKGVLSLRELLLSKADEQVGRFMVPDVFAIGVQDEAMEAARRIRSRHLKMLPVINQHEQLVGVIGIEQAMELLTYDLADDFVAINAASPDESFFTPPKQAIKKRLPWMAANIFLNLGAVVVISSFESTIVQVAILAAFLPMITDMGGNVGIQALSVSIRSMALGEARLRDFWLAVRKEVYIGLFNGLALGALFCVVAFLLEGNLVLGLVAGIALGCNVLVAGVVGGSMPFLIKRWGKDPAMMTGPVLTTITDITGVTIYLGLCTLFLASIMV
ncbi:magnesium transporter [Alkalimonas sp. MEB108]|uniref:Magnesium transporter MgtE n=1 Tax=Alkalimonas cellulosilytica TaxID=3058395 RepID=A0ABU7J0H2_9GAMM|nr:magnesium transporter [Alkalimonas sp. MEB108]MEE1999995.1 magnesium transporter [Alkalimonas sp. MEB108]